MQIIWDFLATIGGDLIVVVAIFVACSIFCLCDAFFKHLYLEHPLTYSTDNPESLQHIRNTNDETNRQVLVGNIVSASLAIAGGILFYIAN
ncbi:hypothetical protein [Shewanella aestuarii]|uniref:Uncharacterized protein n=1 Tax=Shewanella aestuarii TaxID=1028752 RepID=A0A6G9QS70_9GAMM|nr:hypothetical protein [Shewanella aestuarii]QIR16629.1 hypothetical protein HBH39_19325 [Shewanella aestuarii]